MNQKTVKLIRRTAAALGKNPKSMKLVWKALPAFKRFAARLFMKKVCGKIREQRRQNAYRQVS